jgi:hypothetical protein
MRAEQARDSKATNGLVGSVDVEPGKEAELDKVADNERGPDNLQARGTLPAVRVIN